MADAELKLNTLKLELLEDSIRHMNSINYWVVKYAKEFRELLQNNRNHDFTICLTKEQYSALFDFLLAVEKENLRPLPDCKYIGSNYEKLSFNQEMLKKL